MPRRVDGLYLHRARIERAVRARLCNLFSLKVDLVFYDLASSYFEGCRSDYGRLGYSRDERFGNEQIMIGLMLVDGLPIGHHVFRGNRSDKSCVTAAVEDAERRFKIGRIVLVGDRGLLWADSLKMARRTKRVEATCMPGLHPREAGASLPERHRRRCRREHCVQAA